MSCSSAFPGAFSSRRETEALSSKANSPDGLGRLHPRLRGTEDQNVLLQQRLLFRLQADEKVAAELEAQPARRHARRHFEQVRDDALVQALGAFLGDNDTDGVGERLVLVAHARHGVDLETAS